MTDAQLHIAHIVIILIGLVAVLVLRANSKRLTKACATLDRIEATVLASKTLASDNAQKIWTLLQALRQGREGETDGSGT